ncbi:MAG TPA: carboxypeptidase-like regulatory domain-containing protein, partial [Dyadobacter sp.]|nr:carboxypeptidase-like regulatory domain-containing protein [Dyadobacter sp.]
MHIYYSSSDMLKKAHRHLAFLMICLLTVVTSHVVLAQSTITGKVTGAQGNEPLPGVNIVIKGTTTGTSTNVEGTYSINAPKDAVLQFSFIGYEPQEIQVNGRAKIDISLSDDSKALSEVVVIGYGT